MTVVDTKVKRVRKVRFSRTIKSPNGDRKLTATLRAKDVNIRGGEWWYPVLHEEIEAVIDILLAAQAELNTQKHIKAEALKSKESGHDGQA